MFEAPTKRGCRRVSLDVFLTVVAVIAWTVFAVMVVVLIKTLTEVAP